MAWPVSSEFLASLERPTRSWAWMLDVDWASNATEPAPEVSSSTSYDATYMPASNLVVAGRESRPYAVLDSGCLADGSWYTFPEPGTWPHPGNAGWWSAEVSDSSGRFSTPPWVEVSYPADRLRQANLIRVASSRYYPGVGSVRVKYRVQGSTEWTTLGEYGFDGGWYIEAELPDKLTLAALRVEVLSTSQPEDHARLTEVDAIWRQRYTGSNLGRLDVTRRLEFLVAGKYPLGTLAASEVSAEILCDPSEVEPYLRPGIRLCPWWGLHIGEDWEWVPQGVYWADEWECDTGCLSVRGRDRIGLLQSRAFQPRLLSQATMLDAVKYALHHAGVSNPDIVTGDISTTVWDYLRLEGCTPAEALQSLLASTLHHLWCGLDGMVRLRKRAVTGSSVGTITDADILTLPRVYRGERANIVQLEWTDLTRGATQEVGAISESELPQGTQERQGRYAKAPIIAISGISAVNCAVSEFDGDEWGYRVQVDADEDAAVKFIGQPAAENHKTAEAIDWDHVRRGGPRELRISAPTTGATAVQNLANDLLEYLVDGREVVSFDAPPRPHWEAGDVVTISSSRAHLSGNYLITSLSLGAGDVMRLEVTRL